MDHQRYTQSQVLCGLREVWEIVIGTDEAIDIDTQIYAFMKADGSWDDLDLADVFCAIEQFFNFPCSRKEWLDFFGFDIAMRSLDDWEKNFAPSLTFGSLAQFIADRAPAVASFAPIPVLGRYCAGAGIFTGIQCVAEHTTAKHLRFAPSTLISNVMRGNELDRFWTQLRWMTEHSIPKLPPFWRSVTAVAGCLTVLFVAGSLFVAWATNGILWALPFLLIAAALYPMACLYKRLSNPLPKQISSFRDLSLLIAKSWDRAA